MPSRSVGHALVLFGLVSLGALAAGCGDDSPRTPTPNPQPKPGATSFESDLPGSSGGLNAGESSAEAGGDASSRSSGSAPAPMTPPGAQTADRDDGGAARAIVEADMIQLAGDRLYALSRIAGLAVIDVADPKALKLLGRYRELPGDPFEMYLRDDVAILMFKGWGQYAESDDGNPVYVTTSKIVALDVANAAAIRELGGVDVPGTISDSRIVGDVLYVAGYEDGYCWRCEQERPTTSISSLSVADPRAMRKIDELRYSEARGEYSWQRSITVTDQRMYVAGPEYGQNGPVGSTIQVIDISDPAGDLVEGATLQARGEISSRWQMDEYDGVLRVISQQQNWRTTDPPMLQTFQVVSSKEFKALARLNIVIPKRETLRSVRFDGERGYMITAEQMDPLFTLDLSDPAAPKQVGELEMPGWIYHMEPRGDRVLGLGYDQGNKEGSITVSLFDVSDIAAPKMLSRVNFGGDWGMLPEDQDRIHKVFRILAEERLILVPFSGYQRINSGNGAEFCGGKSIGGVQLVNYENDTLQLRGAAPSTGQARRALIHREHLLSVSDQRIEAFDISDRSAPKATSQLIMANTVQYAGRVGSDHVVRITSPDWDGRYFVETVEKSNAEDVNRIVGQLSLDDLFELDDTTCNRWWNPESYHLDGSRLYVLYNGYRATRTGEGSQEHGVAVIDLQDPAAPKKIGQTSWTSNEREGWYTYYGDYTYGGFGRTQPYLWQGDTLAFLEQQYRYDGKTDQHNVRLRVVDLRDAENPKTTALALDGTQQYSGLIANGDRILTSHYLRPTQQLATNRTKFFVASFDVSDPSAPVKLPSVNVPGVLVHYDAASGRAITSDLRRSIVINVTPEECYKRFANAQFNYASMTIRPTQTTPGECVGFVQSLHLVELGTDSARLEDTLTLADNEQIGAWSAGEGRLFATVSRGGGGYYYPGVAVDCAGFCGRGGYYGGAAPAPVQLLVLGGFGGGAFEIGRIEVDSTATDWWGFWGSPPVYADGTKALLVSNGEAAIIEASDLADVRILRTLKVVGSPHSVEIEDGTALLAFGSQGVQWIEM
jgi:hypothetical protein